MRFYFCEFREKEFFNATGDFTYNGRLIVQQGFIKPYVNVPRLKILQGSGKNPKIDVSRGVPPSRKERARMGQPQPISGEPA
jgi:hypothetical protein